MSLKTNLLLSIAFLFIFVLGHPVYEWPDAGDHIQRVLDNSEYYPPSFVVDFNSRVPELSGNHSFFSNMHMFVPRNLPVVENLLRVPFVILFIILVCYTYVVADFKYAVASPPLIFALAQPSQEALAIFVFVIGFALIEKTKIIGLFLIIISTIIDRSMVPNAALLVAVTMAPSVLLLLNKKNAGLIICLLFVILMKSVNSIEFVGNVIPGDILLYNISLDDLVYNSEFGGRNIESLAASVMGLYGWMSIRPEPFLLYYFIVAVLFYFGFKKSDAETRGMMYGAVMVSLLTMWLLPPLSQARYYPVLCILFWRIVYNGLYCVNAKNRLIFSIFILSATAFGMLIPFAR